MDNWFKAQYNDIKGNLKYDMLRTIILGLGYTLYQKVRHLPVDVYLLGTLLLLSIIALFARRKRPGSREIERLSAEVRTNKPVPLEIRPLPGEVLKSFVERAHGATHYRMEIYNSGPQTARNVQVRLIKIEPLPISEYFRARADFPYFVRLAHLADGNVNTSTDHDINSGTSEHFELLFFWQSSDHRIIVDGIDTKQKLRRDAWFPIEEHECWTRDNSPADHRSFAVV